MAKKQELEQAKGGEMTATVNPELMNEIIGDLGKGVSTDAADNLVPLIYVLHPLSPQVLDGPAHIEGARGGDIWLKNFAEDPIVKGKDGIWFQPCWMYQRWTEWIPRSQGGGFIASYDYNGGKLPEGAVRDNSEKKRPKYLFPDTGHDCVDTRYEAGLYWRDQQAFPYVIPFKSTGHAVSRGWMTKRNTLIMRNGNQSGIWPSWSHVYKLTTSMRSNNMGQWFVFDVGNPEFYIPGVPGKPFAVGQDVVGDPALAYQLGKALSIAFSSGQKRAAEEEDTSEDVAAAGDTSNFERYDTRRDEGKPLHDNLPY
jgi:hypothetical protein